MRIFSYAFALAILTISAAVAQGRPDPAPAQKAGMEKLRFLAGTWSGPTTVSQAGKEIRIQQTEEIQYKLGGILMLIEGTGRDEAGKVVFNALAVVSFDPASGKYTIRAWNDGHVVEAVLKVGDKSFEWGFTSGPVTVLDVMKVDEQGRWAETSDATMVDGRKVSSVKMLLVRKL